MPEQRRLPQRKSRKGGRIGPAAEAARAKKEKWLLERLEEDFRRKRLPTWPDHFAKHVGFHSKSALRIYPAFYQELREYAIRTAPSKMRPGRSGTGGRRAGDAGLQVALAEQQQLRLENEALSRELEEMRRALEEERAAHAGSRQQLAAAQGMVDALDDFLAGSNVVRARDVERMLHRLAAAATGKPLRETVGVGTPELTVIDGGLSKRARRDRERSP